MQPQAVQQLLWYLRPVLALGVAPPPDTPDEAERKAVKAAEEAAARVKAKQKKKQAKKKKKGKGGKAGSADGDDDDEPGKPVELPHFLSDLENGVPVVLVEQTRIAFHQLMEAVSMQLVRPAQAGPTPNPAAADMQVRGRAPRWCWCRLACPGTCAVCVCEPPRVCAGGLGGPHTSASDPHPIVLPPSCRPQRT